mmetsp:Transcript_46052/g.128074  ORF Transcript_46052/g.128074 Transcript_46052/m.128074 type:complete len:628 (-) Transcript_46052:499-2382(-)
MEAPDSADMGGGGSGENPMIELEHAVGFSASCGEICYHPNGKKYICAAGASLVVCDFADPHDQVFFRGHDGPVTCLALSNSGRFVASGQHGENADAIVWDYESKRLLYRMSEHDHGIQCLAFSDDELLLCTVGVVDDNKILIWDLSNGFIVTMVSHNPTPCTCVTWGGMIKDIKRRDTANYQLCTSGNQRIVLWNLDPRTGEMVGERVITEGRGTMVRDFTGLAFSDDKETIYCATTSGDFALVNVKRRQLNTVVPACRLGILSLLCWPEGLVVGGGDGTVTTFDANMNDTCQVQLSGPVASLSFSPDKVEVIAGTSTGFVYRLRMDNLQSLLVCENHAAAVKRISFAPDASDRFATLSSDCTIRVWDSSDYSVLTTVTVRDAGEPNCLAYTLDFIITGWEDGRVRAHESDSGQFLWLIDQAHRAGVSALCLSNNERYIMTGGGEGDVRIWEMRSRELVSHLKEHTLPVTSLALYGDDIHALSCSRDRAFLCWDLRNERRLTSHVQRMGGINGIALSQDQTMVITVGQEKRLTCWDLRDHNPVKVTNLSSDMSDEALTVAISSSGKFVATGGTAQLLKLWDYATMELIASCEGHSGAINDLKFSPDDKQLVSVGADGIILVWNLYDV